MTYWRLYYHLVWGTKHRMPLIDEEREVLVRRSIADTCREREVLLHGLGMMPDHVHVVVSIPPRYAIADMVKVFKGASSKLISNVPSPTLLESFGWQRGYGVLSFGGRQLQKVVDYVNNQPVHHAQNQLISVFERLERLPDQPTEPRV
jgi:putative transposase